MHPPAWFHTLTCAHSTSALTFVVLLISVTVGFTPREAYLTDRRSSEIAEISGA